MPSTSHSQILTLQQAKALFHQLLPLSPPELDARFRQSCKIAKEAIAILLDQDGTLVPEDLQSIFDVAYLMNPKVELSTVQRHFAGMRLISNPEFVAEKLGLRVDQILGDDGLIARIQKKQNEEKSSGRIPLLPGVYEVLDYLFTVKLKKGGIVTSSECQPTRSCWSAKNMLHFFGNDELHIVGADDPRIRDPEATADCPNPFLTKPHPRPYQVLLEVFGVSAAEVFAVEDTWKGALSAARAGIQCFFITPVAPSHEELRREFVNGEKDLSQFLAGRFNSAIDFLSFLKFAARTNY